MKSCIFLYSSDSPEVESAVRECVSKLNRGANVSAKTWRQFPIAGAFLGDTIIEEISGSDFVVADITTLNFNVIYEIGYAISIGKYVVPVVNASIQASRREVQALGLFDTLGYQFYENGSQLAKIVQESDLHPLPLEVAPSTQSPVFYLQPKVRTDQVLRLSARLTRTQLGMETFDPAESPRMSALIAKDRVSKCLGLVIPLLPEHIEDHRFHNSRAAFLAGLGHGLDRETLILQLGDSPVPADYRDLVTQAIHPDAIDEGIQTFAENVTGKLTSLRKPIVSEAKSFLAKLELGGSNAENESDLADYYIETEAYFKTSRGEVQLVVGRKGSGKTALFYQLEETRNKGRNDLVVGIKPEGFRLLKFRNRIKRFLEIGTYEHTVTAFWEYLLLLELCSQFLNHDKELHKRDHTLFQRYTDLRAVSRAHDLDRRSDFSERMSGMIDRVVSEFETRMANTSEGQLSTDQITDLIYKTDIRPLWESVKEYAKTKSSIWLLFDNLDRGWPTRGLEEADQVIIQSLLAANLKVEKELNRVGVDAHSVVFLRSDIYELLVEHSRDRGKESKISVDWSDKDMLKELLRKRLERDIPGQPDFDEIWRDIAVSHIDGVPSSNYILDHCLMRPRYLLDLVSHCKGVAVNRNHDKIEGDDIRTGIEIFSSDVVEDLNQELADVDPSAKDVLYQFLGADSLLSVREAEKVIGDAGVSEANVEDVRDMLLWFGFFGVNDGEGSKFIFDFIYNFKLFKAFFAKYAEQEGLVIHPAFEKGLLIRG